MAGCGYVCPLCEGTGYLEGGKECEYCSVKKPVANNNPSDQEWMDSVHNSTCCSDLGKKEDEQDVTNNESTQ